jgi:hypothetical protein
MEKGGVAVAQAESYFKKNQNIPGSLLSPPWQPFIEPMKRIFGLSGIR